jgi:hypothetical protein
MSKSGIEIKTVKVSTDKGDLFVCFDPMSAQYTCFIKDSGISFSLSDETMKNLIEFTQTLKPDQVVSNKNTCNGESDLHGVEDRVCRNCEKPIHLKTLERNPETKICADCSSQMNPKNRKIEEPFGTRSDYIKDRDSYGNNS